MRGDEIRFLFAYDRWATRRVLDALDGLDPAAWARTDVVGERGLGSILVHQLGSSQRWRILFEARATDERVRPELEPLPTIEDLRARWEAEWAAVDAWLQTLTDGFLADVHEGVPVWQLLVHVVNHGTQHRAEAAALLTAEGGRRGSLICSTTPKSKPTAAAEGDPRMFLERGPRFDPSRARGSAAVSATDRQRTEASER